MKNISDIYSKYKIMPTLQAHQFRVAAVAKQLCDSISLPLNTEAVVKVCLLHDMGNILKFDLSYFPDFLQPEGLEYWQQVKDEYTQKYGKDEHLATDMICKELGFSDIEMQFLDAVGYSNIKKTLASDSLEGKICLYSDLRVGPYGVLSLDDRIADARKRYQNRKDHAVGREQLEEFDAGLRQIEKILFGYSSMLPSDINDASIEPIVAALKSQ